MIGMKQTFYQQVLFLQCSDFAPSRLDYYNLITMLKVETRDRKWKIGDGEVGTREEG